MFYDPANKVMAIQLAYAKIKSICKERSLAVSKASKDLESEFLKVIDILRSLKNDNYEYLEKMFQNRPEIYQIVAIQRACAMVKFRCEEKNCDLPNLPIVSEASKDLKGEFEKVISILKTLSQDD
jgi:hypothetical protein